VVVVVARRWRRPRLALVEAVAAARHMPRLYIGHLILPRRFPLRLGQQARPAVAQQGLARVVLAAKAGSQLSERCLSRMAAAAEMADRLVLLRVRGVALT
jgi:hypothetical protein